MVPPCNCPCQGPRTLPCTAGPLWAWHANVCSIIRKHLEPEMGDRMRWEGVVAKERSGKGPPGLAGCIRAHDRGGHSGGARATLLSRRHYSRKTLLQPHAVERDCARGLEEHRLRSLHFQGGPGDTGSTTCSQSHELTTGGAGFMTHKHVLFVN